MRRKAFWAGLSIVLGLVAVGGLLSLFGQPVHADSFTLSVKDVAEVGSLTVEGVDTGHGAAPEPAAIPLFSPGNCTVTSTLDSGPGSLRDCMVQLGAGDVITFDTAIFPPGNPQTIALNNPLPDIVTDNVTIDGSNAGVVLDGSGTPEGTDGLVIDSASNVVIKGLQVLNLPGNGIELRNGASNNTIGGTNATPGGACSGDCNLISGNGNDGVSISGSSTMSNTVSGNYIGTDVSGTSAISNTYNGVLIWDGASYNVIGGDTAGERNLISGNGIRGVDLHSSAMNNTVRGNYIGIDTNGTSGLGNVEKEGVIVSGGAHHNTIGPDNVISSNGRFGIVIADAETMSNTVISNFIGTDASGEAALGNSASGILVFWGARYNVIEGNVISGNSGNGVSLGEDAVYNTFRGNYIGTNANGTAAIPNGASGIQVREAAQYNIIGGNTPSERNLISGNGSSGVSICDSGTMHNTISGNYIGTDVSGTAAVPNENQGVEIRDGAQYNVIGGDTAGEGNLISGNGSGGVRIYNSGDNIIKGNYIGTDAAGTSGLANNDDGVLLHGSTQRNTVGPTNTIAYNSRFGVLVVGSTTLSNTITQNSIYNNMEKGIELYAGGNLELFPPILDHVTADTVTGIAVPNSIVEVFSDNEDEGQAFEGSTTADGSGSFTFNQPGGFTLFNVTATATDGNGNTSEFSDGQAPLVDAAAEVIFQPGNSSLMNQSVTPSVKVSNPGTSVAANVNVTVQASGPALSTGYNDSTIVASLNPLTYRTLEFNSFTPTTLGSYVFTLTVSLAGDQDPSNDVLVKTVAVADARVDVWTKDNPSDNGDVPTTDWWQSPDLWVRNQDDGQTTHQNPVSGTVNYVYVRVRNRGTLTATNTLVKVYWHEPALGIACGSWADIGQQTVTSLAPGATQIISFTWTPTRTGHTCLFDVLESDQDPVTYQCDVSWDNNIEQRNVEIIAHPPEGASALAATNINFDVVNVNSRAALVDVVLDRSTVPAVGSVTLDLGSALFDHWQSVNGGTPLDGAVVMSGSVISITSSSTAIIRSLPLLGYESRPLTLTVDTPSAVDSTVSVYEVIDGNVMGGNTFHFVTEGGPIYLPIILKSY